MSHRLVVVGYGTMGVTHRERLADVEGIEVVGAVDIDPVREQYAVEDGLHVYSDLEAALQDDSVDFVFVCTPNDSHRPIAEAALRAGKHVMCEKPAMLNSRELEAVVGLAERSGRIFAVHQNRRWDEDYLSIKRLYDDKTLGPTGYIETRVHGSRGIPGDWRTKKAQGGGMLLDWGTHLVDRLLIMVDSPVVGVFGRLSFVLGKEVDDGFKAYLMFANGIEALVDVSTTNYIPLPKWLLQGARGTATIDDWQMNGKVLLHEVDLDQEADATPIVAGAGMTKTMAPRKVDFMARTTNDPGVRFLPLPRVPADVRSFYSNVLDAADGKAELIVKHEQVLRTLRLLEAVEESHRTREVIPFETAAP
jgi:scyllo-inositol 2-dehydrogenase (NADP+)